MTAERRFIVVIAALGLVLLAGSLRFSAPEFRPWEMVKQRNGYLFRPDQRVEMEEIGDLGYRSWVRAVQRRRHVVFTTDSHGFRNAREMPRPPVVVLGDSYVVGVGLSDAETLSERLSARLGVDVYNYGLGIGGTPQLFLADQRFVGSPPRLMVYAPVQRMLKPRPVLLAAGRWPDGAGPVPPWKVVDESVLRFFTHLDRDNGLTVAARYGWNGLRYRLFGLPDTILVEGQRMLVLPIEEQYLEVPAAERDPAGVVRSLQALQAVLASRGIRLLFCPIFEAATIYPDLYPAAARARIQQPSMLDVVISGARRAGISTVDLRPTFRQNRFPYLYQPDDSHWNPRAVDLAAEAIVRGIRRGPPFTAPREELRVVRTPPGSPAGPPGSSRTGSAPTDPRPSSPP
jgi:hypothetical protein